MMASALISKSLVLVALVGVLQGTSASGPGAHGARDNHSKLHLDVELDAPVVRKSKLDAETELLKEATHDLALGNVNTDVFKNFANYQEDETILVFMDDEETEHALLDENLLIGAEEEIEYDNDLIAEVPKDAEDWLQKADAWSLDTNNWLVDDPKQSGHGASKTHTTKEEAVVRDDCPQPRQPSSGGWKVFLVLLGIFGILGPILYSTYTLMGPISLENSVAVRSLQGLDPGQIKNHFQSHPDIFTQTMQRGFEANPDAFVDMLIRSNLFQFQRPRQSFVQRSLRSATRSLGSMFGRRDNHGSTAGDIDGDQHSLV